MANRFLETNYFKSPFVKSLEGKLKSFYSFIICDCTPAGMWFLDLDAVKHYTGFEITMKEFDDNFIKTGKSVKVSTGKYFFPDFIEHQYPGGLSDVNKAHKNILIELRKYNLLTESNLPKKEAPLEEPLCDSFKGIQGIGQGIGIGQDQGNTAEIQDKYLIPEMFNVFKKQIPSYPGFIDKDYKPLLNISIFIHRQNKLNGNHVENKAIIIKKWEQLCSVISDDGFYKQKSLSVISNQIQEIFQIQLNGKSKNDTNKTNAGNAGKTAPTDSI